MKTQPVKTHPMLIPRIVLTASLIAISVISYYFINHTSNVLELSSRISHITGNQRTLCSQVINSIAADNIGGKLEGAPLNKTLDKFVRSQALFFKTDSMLNTHFKNRDLSHLNTYLQNTCDIFLTNVQQNIDSDSADKFVDLLAAQDDYLSALDKYTSALNSRAITEVETFKSKETTILIASLIFVFLEIILLFLPAVRKIKQQNQELVAMNEQLQKNHQLMQSHIAQIEEKNEVLKKIAHIQSHEVRHPLTSVMALVNLADDGHPVDEQWLQMMHDACRSLDARIRSIIRESETDKELKVARYDKMVEQIEQYAIIMLDAEGRIEIWNGGAENVLGYMGFEVTGKNFSMFYSDPNERATRIYHLLKEASDKGFIRDESLYTRKDGSQFYASTLLTAIHNDDTREITGYTGIIQLLSNVDTVSNSRKTPA